MYIGSLSNQNEIAMITRQQIIEYATLKGLKYEETFPHTYNRYTNEPLPKEYLSEEFRQYQIGLNTRDGIWYWFDCWVVEPNNVNEGLFFRQRYSQNTGNVCKSFNTGFNLELKIENTLNK